MSVRKEIYIIQGLKFGEEFTNEYFDKDFRDEMEFDKKKEVNRPYFLTDGMNGEYTFFGFITQIEDGYCEFEDCIEIKTDFDKKEIIRVLSNYYKLNEIHLPEIKTYLLSHYV